MVSNDFGSYSSSLMRCLISSRQVITTNVFYNYSNHLTCCLISSREIMITKVRADGLLRLFFTVNLKKKNSEIKCDWEGGSPELGDAYSPLNQRPISTKKRISKAPRAYLTTYRIVICYGRNFPEGKYVFFVFSICNKFSSNPTINRTCQALYKLFILTSMYKGFLRFKSVFKQETVLSLPLKPVAFSFSHRLKTEI